jgi:hypothetical protein
MAGRAFLFRMRAITPDSLWMIDLLMGNGMLGNYEPRFGLIGSKSSYVHRRDAEGAEKN